MIPDNPSCTNDSGITKEEFDNATDVERYHYFMCGRNGWGLCPKCKGSDNVDKTNDLNEKEDLANDEILEKL